MHLLRTCKFIVDSPSPTIGAVGPHVHSSTVSLVFMLVYKIFSDVTLCENALWQKCMDAFLLLRRADVPSSFFASSPYRDGK